MRVVGSRRSAGLSNSDEPTGAGHGRSDAFKERFQEAGFEVTMGGRIGETIEFYYVDTMPAVHFVAESGSGHAIDLEPVRQYPPQPAETKA